MKTGSTRRRARTARPLNLIWTFLLGQALTVTSGAAEFPQRTQEFELTQGWNAIYLEVEPAEAASEIVFAGTPIDVAARLFRSVRAVRSPIEPEDVLLDRDGWGVWYGPDRPEAFLSTLFAVHGYGAYLIHAREDFTWEITGKAFARPIKWTADSFNLVGFPVDTSAAPTFREFFAGAGAHEAQPVFRMVGGAWKEVTEPATTSMRRGEAYWVYCEGGSDYQGPFEVGLAFGDHLRFTEERDHNRLTIRNRSANPVSVTIQQRGSDPRLPLMVLLQGLLKDRIQYLSVALPDEYEMPSLESGMAGEVQFRLRRADDLEGGAVNLLRIRSDAGTEHWVSVYGSR